MLLYSVFKHLIVLRNTRNVCWVLCLSQCSLTTSKLCHEIALLSLTPLGGNPNLCVSSTNCTIQLFSMSLLQKLIFSHILYLSMFVLPSCTSNYVLFGVGWESEFRSLVILNFKKMYYEPVLFSIA